MAQTSWISASRQVNSALFLTRVIFTMSVFWLWYAPAVPPELEGGTTQIWGSTVKKKISALRAGVHPTSKPCRRLCKLVIDSFCRGSHGLVSDVARKSATSLQATSGVTVMWIELQSAGAFSVLARETTCIVYKAVSKTVPQWYCLWTPPPAKRRWIYYSSTSTSLHAVVVQWRLMRLSLCLGHV